MVLCLAGSIRNAAGYVWGYNNNTYYTNIHHQTPDQISSYLGVIPLVSGIIGSFFGGFVSDRVAKKAKPWQRIWILVLSQVSLWNLNIMIQVYLKIKTIYITYQRLLQLRSWQAFYISTRPTRSTFSFQRIYSVSEKKNLAFALKIIFCLFQSKN